MSEQDNLQEAEGTIENTTVNTDNNVVRTEKITTTPDETSQEIEGKNTESAEKTIDNKQETTTIPDKALQEIEDENAEDAEDQENAVRHEIEEKNYHTMDMDNLVEELSILLKNNPVQTINKQVNLIKTEFDAKFSEFIDTKKEEFLAEGGNIIDFRYHSTTQNNFKNSYAEFRSKRNKYYKGLEQNLKSNLEVRNTIIDKIKALIENSNNINSAYNEFKGLQAEWRDAGAIPRDRYNTVWNTYHHHVERFYDYLHLDRDFRNLDFKHNLEEKQKIVAKAQELTEENNINKAFRELQNLHKLWKEEIGPVAKEFREGIWNQFSAATKIIHKKRQDFFTETDKVYELNLSNKNAIIDKIKEITENTSNEHKDWQSKIKDIEALRELFFNEGKVPYKLTEKTWSDFKSAVRDFNKTKNIYYKGLKKGQLENFAKKQALIQIAEDNKDNDDFSTTTPLMKKIQADWRKVGHVPRKDSDKLWKKFKASCNYYFDRIHTKKNEANAAELEALTTKEAYLEKIQIITLNGEHQEKLTEIKKHIAHWKTIGFVPHNKREINDKFNQAIDNLFNQLNIDKSEVEAIKYENRLRVFEGDERALNSEMLFIKRKIDEEKAVVLQLENNLSFFANAKKDNPLVKDVYTKISRKKSDLDAWKKKLQQLKSILKKQAQEESETQTSEKDINK